MCYMRVLVDKMAVKIRKSKKHLHIVERFWLKLFNNAIDPLKVRFNSIDFNAEAQEFKFLYAKLTFAKLGV